MQKANNDIVVFLIVITLVILIMAGFILSILFLYRRRQVNYLKELEQIKLDVDKNLLSTQLEIQEQTFQAISREIHDNISLSLTLAKLQLNTIDFTDQSQIPVTVHSATSHISKAIDDLRDISRNLNADLVLQQGLTAVLETEVEKIQKTGFYNIELIISGNTVFLEGQKELVIFRIIQESLNNILKHAKAKNIELLLNYKPTQLEITIKDNGTGFIFDASAERKTAGLTNMQKRAALIGGQCTIVSIPDEGTSVNLYIPI
jgi:two-component system, NarL family, sensor kinase